MAYVISYTLNVQWVGDGVGAMSVPSAQVKTFTQSSRVLVPGADAPTLANFNTALTGSSSTPSSPSMAADLNAQINTALAQIQGFATGGG